MWRRSPLPPLALLLLAASAAAFREFTEQRICIGTNGRMSVPSNSKHHYRNLRERYTNCTYVDGNLEVTWVQDPELDLSFLQHIREVTGYVLISHVDVPRVVLPSLQIVRGRTLFRVAVHEEDFALMILLSKMSSLEMPALRDILQGNVGLLNNYNLCHIKTINWAEIITDPGAHVVHVYNFSMPERECSPCHSSCEAGCWGEGSHNCQKFSKVNCSPQCHQGRCFGTNPRECCHLFCAGGCRGPKQSDCLSCRNFYDNGVCTEECPPTQIYNSITYSWESNPNGKYAYGSVCVKKCPDHLLKENGACVRSCSLNKRNVDGECVLCDGPCPKKCVGESSIHSGNINKFRNCTEIEGSISILDTSFKGFQHIYSNYTFGNRYRPMHPDQLEVFSTLKKITGFLHIDAAHQDFRNLSYFRNLEVIGGRQLTDYFASLYIVQTSLTSLGLYSLKNISSGSIAILENPDLCFPQNINWTRIKTSPDHNIVQSNNKDNNKCIAEGMVCDEECSAEGCWGTGPNQCLSCVHFQLDNRCLRSCSTIPGMYQSGKKMCNYCHEECASTCHGPGSGNCTLCKHTKDGSFCTSECPVTKYPNENGECRPCHKSCVDGCTGPHNAVGSGGCNSCEKAIISGNVTVGLCLQKNESCPNGYYHELLGPQRQGPLKPLEGKAVCRSCHPRCKKCTGYGFHEQVCQECALYKRGEQCEDECPLDHYADDVRHECIPCNRECRECFGPTNVDCKSRQNLQMGLAQRQGATSAQECSAGGKFRVRMSAASQRNESGLWQITATASSDVAFKDRPRVSVEADLDVDECTGGRVTLTATAAVTTFRAVVPPGYERFSFPGVTSLYRLHPNALTWPQAQELCRTEGAHLIVVNSEAEALVVNEFFQRRPQIPGAFNMFWLAVGVQRRGGVHNYTVLGGRLEDSGYNKWAPLDGQWNPGASTDCGIMDARLLFAYEGCTHKRGFICELEQ